MTLADHQQLQHDAFNAAGAASARLFRNWTSDDPAVEGAREALAEWDGQHRRESYAAALYRFVAPGVAEASRETALAASRKRVLEPWIRTAMDSLRTRLGSDPSGWRWGRFNRSQFPHAFIRSFDIPEVERHGGAGFVAAVGATYRQVIDMNDPDASVATNAPGQSGQPGSPFYRNLVDAYGRGEYFPLAYSRAAVERVQAHRLILAGP